MSEEEGYIRSLPIDQLLEKVPFDEYKWVCCIEGCNNGSKIKDFGISPAYHWRKKFLDLEKFVFLCGKHRRFKILPSGMYARHKELGNYLKLKEGPGIDHLIKK